MKSLKEMELERINDHTVTYWKLEQELKAERTRLEELRQDKESIVSNAFTKGRIEQINELLGDTNE